MKKTTRVFRALLALFISITILVGCKEDEDPQPYFTLTADALYNPSALKHWVMLHDEQGEPIGAKSFAAGEIVKFDSLTAPEHFSVTLLSYYGNQNYSHQTYLGETSHAEWTLQGPKAMNTGSPSGHFEFRVSDAQLGNPSDAAVSDGHGLGQSLGPSESQIDFLKTKDVYANNKYFVSVTDNNGVSKYKFLEQAPTGNVSYALSDLSFFDQQTTLSFPSTSNYFTSVIGCEAGQGPDSEAGYLTNLRWSGFFTQIAKSSLTLGFLNRFPNYLIFTSASYDNHVLSYKAFGPKPSGNINLTNDINVTVTENTWANFNLSSTDYAWYSAYWTSTIETSPNNPVYRSWAVFGANTQSKNPKRLPAIVKAEYADLDMTAFSYSAVEINKSSRSFTEYLTHHFKGGQMTAYEDRGKFID
jgi:hypothetical protein